jgi:hypothetical protein
MKHFIGEKAFLDSACGLVPVVVTNVTPATKPYTLKRVHATVKKNFGPYVKGESVEFNETMIVPVGNIKKGKFEKKIVGCWEWVIS